jgi:hypothetical protein
MTGQDEGTKCVFERLADEAFSAVLPAHAFDVEFEGQRISIPQFWLYFREYNGASPQRCLRKPIVGTPDRPFAELQIVKRLEDQGCNVGWLHGREPLSSWEPRERVQFPRWARALLNRIEARAGSNANLLPSPDYFSFN